jgi:hypothetical protein
MPGSVTVLRFRRMRLDFLSWRRLGRLRRAALPAYRSEIREVEVEDEVRKRFGDGPLARDLGALGDVLDALPHPLCVDTGTLGPDGTLFLALTARLAARDVRTGDAVIGGLLVAGHATRDECRVSPRILRVVCGNGAVLPTREVCEEGEYVRATDLPPTGSIEEAVRVGLSGRRLDGVVEGLRTLAEMPAGNLREAFLPFGIAVPSRHEDAMRRRFLRGGDPTVYGAFNALTETARDARDPRTREALERLAGRLVLSFRRETAGVLV